jgi:hypothetical protein
MVKVMNGKLISARNSKKRDAEKRRKETKKVSRIKKTIRRREKKVVQIKGNPVELKRILISSAIVKATLIENPNLDLLNTGFKMLPKDLDKDKELKRMKFDQEAFDMYGLEMGILGVKDFDKFMKSNPVELRIIMTDELGFPLYEVLNGRHRLTRSIAEGKETINAILSN